MAARRAFTKQKLEGRMLRRWPRRSGRKPSCRAGGTRGSSERRALPPCANARETCAGAVTTRCGSVHRTTRGDRRPWSICSLYRRAAPGRSITSGYVTRAATSISAPIARSRRSECGQPWRVNASHDGRWESPASDWPRQAAPRTRRVRYAPLRWTHGAARNKATPEVVRLPLHLGGNRSRGGAAAFLTCSGLDCRLSPGEPMATCPIRRCSSFRCCGR